MVKSLLLIFILGSCALQSRKDQDSLRKLFVQKNFAEAEEYLESSSLKEKKNKLLYLMDKGVLNFYQKKYGKAARVFNEANKLVDKLYTKSVREMLASSVVNENAKTFYGSLFERSMLYYFQALSFYHLSDQGYYWETKQVDGKATPVKRELSAQEKNKNRDRVRSTLVAWDSFFKEMQRIKGAKTFFKKDYFAKVFAAQMHESLGTKRDLEIANQLYRDAYAVFSLYAPTLKTFNGSYVAYNKELRNYFDKKLKKDQLKSLKMTEEYKIAENYLQTKILELTKKVRPRQLSRYLRKFKRKKSQLESRNVTFHLEVKTVSPTKGKDFSFNLRSAIAKIEDPNKRDMINAIGVPILTGFAMGPLGLGYVSHHGNVSIYSGHSAGTEMMKEVGIEFELPYAAANKDKVPGTLVVKKGEKVIREVKLAPLTSISDMAFINSQEVIANSFNKRATRVGIKYAIAIMAAYGTYKRMMDSDGALFAKPAAIGQFLLSQKGIKETEKADVRHWTTLPNLVMSASLELAAGTYQVFLKKKKGEKFLKSIVVDGVSPELFSHRVF